MPKEKSKPSDRQECSAPVHKESQRTRCAISKENMCDCFLTWIRLDGKLRGCGPSRLRMLGRQRLTLLISRDCCALTGPGVKTWPMYAESTRIVLKGSRNSGRCCHECDKQRWR